MTGALRPMRCVHGNVLVVLLFVHLWLASSSLKVPQVVVELVLGVWLIALVARCRLQIVEVVLIALYGASMAASFAFNELTVTLLNMKILGLAILSLIVFSKYEFDLRPAHWILGGNVAVILYQAAFGDPLPVVWLMQNVAGSWSGIVNSRPTGLFMSTHLSASLAALFLIWLGYRRRIFGLGFVCLGLSRSFFNLAAYAGQLGANLLVRFRLARLTLVCLVVAAAFIGVFAEHIRDFDLMQLSSLFSHREQISYDVVMGQILSPDAYRQALTFVPSDSKKLAGVIFAGSEFGNEIGYFTLMQQGGFLLAALYLWMLFSRLCGFKVFLALSMLHYGLATPPVAVFLMVQWARRLHAKRSTEAAAQPDTGIVRIGPSGGRGVPNDASHAGAASAPST